jgi:hypothetical protein
MPYVERKLEGTIGDMLDKSDIEELRDELREWADNMSSTSLSNTEKCQEVSDAADELDRVDELDLDQLTGLDLVTPLLQDKVAYSELRPYDKRRQPSRSYRLSNAISRIRAAFDYLDSKLGEQESANEYRSMVDDAESTLSDLDNVDIPGMY